MEAGIKTTSEAIGSNKNNEIVKVDKINILHAY